MVLPLLGRRRPGSLLAVVEGCMFDMLQRGPRAARVVRAANVERRKANGRGSCRSTQTELEP